jgi:hypothetical protein
MEMGIRITKEKGAFPEIYLIPFRLLIPSDHILFLTRGVIAFCPGLFHNLAWFIDNPDIGAFKRERPLHENR